MKLRPGQQYSMGLTVLPGAATDFSGAVRFGKLNTGIVVTSPAPQSGPATTWPVTDFKRVFLK